MRTAVVVVSVGGSRPWLDISLKWINFYCSRFGFDLLLCRLPTISELVPQQFDRFKNFGRCQKLGIGFLFDKYDRVIQVDDTCIFSPHTPNLIRLVPEESIGCYVEGTRWGEKFQLYLDTHKLAYERNVPLPRERFYNSGMTVYSKCHAMLFELSAIPWNTIQADTAFPTQGYLSHKAEELGFPLCDLGHSFNFVGSMIKRTPELENTPIYVFHLTGVLKRRERTDYARRIDRLFQGQLVQSVNQSAGRPFAVDGGRA